MFTIIGIVVALVAIMVGYTMHGGNVGVLIQINEFIILAGAGVGSLIAANGMKGFQGAIKGVLGLLKPDPFTKQAYTDLLKMMYQLFNVARKEGLLGLEKHIEAPAQSDILGKYPGFLANHHACDFFCDTLKVILTGSVGPHDLAEMMELDLEVAHKEAHLPAEAIQTVGDAMPGFGIVAAVLGIIITMGKIGGEAAAIGESVGASLVGTFLGILLAYGVFAPMSKAMSLRLETEGQYMNCIRYALFSFARGESPITCVEFARRNIETAVRPGFSEMEQAVKGMSANQPIIIKKKKVSGHGGHHGGSWKVAYADFVTAMMAFFMVMWIMGMSAETRKAIQSYFNDPMNFKPGELKSQSIFALSAAGAGKKHEVPVDKDYDAEQKALESAAQKVKADLAQMKGLEGLEKEVKVTITPEGLQIELVEARGAVFFESGSATIRPVAQTIVAHLAPILKKTGKPLVIEGHTDAAPFAGPGGNLGLSADRATSLFESLRADGVPETQVRQVVGYGATRLERPDAPTDFSNRRVTILIPREAGASDAPPAASLRDHLKGANEPEAVDLGTDIRGQLTKDKE